MLIQSTKALQKYLKVNPEPRQELADPLQGWHAHFKKINRKNTIILVHDLSLYTIVLYGLKAKDVRDFASVAKHAIVEMLKKDGCNDQVVYPELLGESVSYTTTKDRKSVAKLNRIAQEIEFFMDEVDTDSLLQPGISDLVNRNLYKSSSGGYMKPIKSLYHLLENKIGSEAFQQRAIQVKITLKLEGIPVWRRLVIPINRTFRNFHDIVQIVFNWTNSHLYEFNLYHQKPTLTGHYLPAADLLLVAHQESFAYQKEGQTMRYAHQCTLKDALDKYKSMVYTYDIGDDWQHVIELEKWLEGYDGRYPVCLDGEGATPPEDVGGSAGYHHFLEVIKSEEDPEREQMLNWAKSAGYQPFDKEKVNEELIRRT
ncbi:plasmid pRiA4b ORF-3 family protein [Gracilibacillus massiliensis]|uniref:plasmid pRiA4b ORF-3 family protein n=1 Tax=Gracilibacillus massiliensis TaxID=1564956 RepID=UPI00071CCCB7|nr:plasmid pRiA4b ORF-3 family protein [Gracilibacillus massiliensis]